MELADRPVCLILGVSGGIGTELARLVAPDYDLVLASRPSSRLSALSDELDADRIELNATSFDEIHDAIAGLPRLDAAINLVGSMLLKPAHLTTQAELQATVEENLFSAFGLVRSASRAMKTGGSIVLTSSCAASVGLANHEAIAAAKGAVEALTRSAAATYAARNVRVNAIAPGLVETKLTERLTGNDASRRASTAMHPIGRIGQPADIARAARWLLDPASDWITGQVIGVDGGLAQVRGKGT